MSRPDILVAPPETLRRALSTRVAGACRRACDERGLATVAVTGGSSFRALGGGLICGDVLWGAVHVFWGDERAVPADHAESNYRLAREVWLDHVPIPDGNIHRMPADAADLDAAAEAYGATLAHYLGPDGRLDVVLLGAGPDGHVCSLFAGAPAMAESGRSVVAVYDSPKPPLRRITLTLPVLASARLVVVLALGSEKSEAVRESLREPLSPLPLARVVSAATSTLFLLDPAAAALAGL